METKTEATESFDKEKIIALLKPNIRAIRLQNEFQQFGLKAQRQVSRSENRFLFTYDTTTIQPDELLEKIQAVYWVLEANFPKIVTAPRVNDGN